MRIESIKVFNGRVITPFGLLPNGSVIISGDKIVDVVSGDPDIICDTVIDARGKYISPGFIDIHVHGGGGYDFMDGTEKAFLKIAEFHSRFGTTSLSPTTLTGSKQGMLNTLEAYEQATASNEIGSQLLGMHLEGPYLAMNQKGAQDGKYIRNPDPLEYTEIVSTSKNIARWSIAPELPGAIEMGRFLRGKGILPAIAHTDAIYEEVLEAFNNGFTLVTHLYSAMSGVTRRNAFRYAGVIESAFIIDEMDVEIIGDGIHVPAPLLKLVYKIKGAEKIALITDAMRGAGMPPGESVIGHMESGLKVILEDGVAKLPDRTSFAGSIATADQLVRNMVQLADVPVFEAVKMATSTPARILGLSDIKGTLTAKKDADLIIYDDSIRVSLTMCRGKVLHDSGSHLLHVS